MTRTTRTLSLLALMAVLVALLLVLVPNLGRIELRPGEVSATAPAGVETVTPSLGPNPTGAVAYAVFLRILFIGALVCLGLIVVGAIFKKSLRIYLLVFAVLVALIVGLYQLASRAPEPEPRAQEDTGLGGLLEPGEAIAPDETPDSPPPAWSFTATAIALSIAAGILVAIVLTRLASRWRRRTPDPDKTELEELIETVGAAADDIHLGGDPRSAVLRCYREMIRIFAKRSTLDHAHMTARELAEALHRTGFTARHVDQLTEIFELVRYGNRGGRTLAERALDCLEAIREAYAT